MCHFPNFEFVPHLILVSCSLGTHRKVSDTNPPACTPHRRLKAKQVATSTIRRDGMATTTTWTRCPSVQIMLKRKLQCKIGQENVAFKEIGFNGSNWIVCSSMNVNLLCLQKNVLRLVFLGDHTQWSQTCCVYPVGHFEITFACPT